MSGSGFLPPGAIGPVALGGGIGVPPVPVPVAGAELIVNGDFSSAIGWSTGDGWTIADGVATKNGGSDRWIYRNVASISKSQFHQTQFDIVSIASGGINLLVGGFNGTITRTTIGTFLEIVNPAPASGTTFYVDGVNSDTVAVVDNVSCKLLSHASTISARAYASADCDISVAINRTPNTQAGIAGRVDDPANPANFIIAYLNLGFVRVDKYVAGVLSNLIVGGVTYGAGRILRLVCNGNNVSCYYHGTQVGTTQTVSDAGIVGNKNHGLFSTYAANTFTGYVAA